MVERWKVGAVSGIIIFIGAIVCIWALYFKPFVRTNDAQIDGFKVSLSADISARLMKIYVDEGTYVKQGDLICDLDDSILQSEKKRSEAHLIASSSAVLLEKYHYEKLFNDFERAQKGFNDGVLSEQEFDHAQKNLSIAKSKLDFAEANHELAQKELGVIEAKLLHTKVFAPMNGMIVKRWIYNGDVVAEGQTLFSLYDTDNVWVLANLEETKIRNIRIGDTVDIYVDAYPGKTFRGQIFAMKDAAASNFSLIPQDNATGNYTKVAQRIPLKISIKKPKDSEPLYLFPGMSAEIKIRTDK